MTEPTDGIIPARPQDYGRSLLGFRAWHGMTLGTLLRVMKGHWGDVSPSRYPVIATMLWITSFNQMRKWVSQVVHEPHVQKTEIAPDPVFVIGHWRSGTTWLHQTLLADPAFAAPTAQACFCPEAFLAGYETLKPLTARYFPEKRVMDNVAMSVDSAEEDEWGIALSGGPSAMLRHMFPLSDMKDGISFHADMTPEQLAQWRRVWVDFLRRVQYVNPGRRLLLKSPGHTARIPEILKIFPDARFIKIVRDPYRIIHSARRTARMLRAIESLQSHFQAGRPLEDRIFRRFEKLYDAYNASVDLIPEGHLVTVRYEDLRRDVTGTIRHIYETVDLGDYDSVAHLFEDRARLAAGYKTNPVTFDPDLVARIDHHCAGYFEQYGYRHLSDRTEATA